MSTIRFGYADTRCGQIHYAECGTGSPVVLLHQTPRSWDEYREVLPLLGASRRAIAMDMVGFGASAPATEHSIETYADGVVALFEALGLDRAALVGHHTGGVVAVEVAARAPERVERLVLSSTAYVDAAARKRRESRPPIDGVEEKQDGSHLTELWQRRQRFYPAGRPDILTRFARDALTLGPDVEKGHEAVGAYRMEDRVCAIGCPTLVIGASDDPFAFPELEPLAARIAHARTAVVEGGTIALMEHKQAEVAELILDFLS